MADFKLETSPLPIQPPLRGDDDGAIRVGNTRIRLAVIVEQYKNGMKPDEIVHAYDTLTLADVDAVIAYYLGHRDEVDGYLKRLEERAEALRTKIEAEHPPISRAALLARRAARENGNAATGQ